MRQKRSFGWVASCLVGLGLGCGRSSLVDTGEDAIAGSATSAGVSSGGSLNVGSGGKGSSGSSLGGTFAGAGVAGFVNSAGFPSGGASSNECQLAVGDCRRESDVACVDSRETCEGAQVAQGEFGSDGAWVRDVATSSSGRVAIVGAFVGVLDFGGSTEPLISIGPGPGNSDAFVASFDALGNVEWALAFSSDGVDTASGVHFTAEGGVVVQGKRGPMSFVLRVNSGGEPTGSSLSGCERCEPGRVAVDNDGNTVLSGSYQGELNLNGASLTHGGLAGYVVKLNPAGSPLWAKNVVPESWASAVITGVATDVEGSIVVVGNGELGTSTGAFFQKISASADERFTRQLKTSGRITFKAVAVDRQMNIVVTGELQGKMSSAGEVYGSSSDAVADLWWARYDGDGQLAVQRLYSTDGKGVSVDAATVDPFGNVLLAASSPSLSVDGLAPVVTPGLHVLKLRSDAVSVWLRSVAGSPRHAVLAADNQANLWVGGSFDSRSQPEMPPSDPTGLHGFLWKLGP